MKSNIKAILCIIILCIMLEPFCLPGSPGNAGPIDEGGTTGTTVTTGTTGTNAARGTGAPTGAPIENTIEALPFPHPFYDSQILNDALVNAGNQYINCPFLIGQEKILVVLKILAKYSTNEEFRNEVNAQTVLSESFVKGLAGKLDEFNKNSFLVDYISALKCSLSNYLLSLQQQAALPWIQIYLTQSPSGPTFPPGIGLLSPTAVVETLSTFIAKRFKEELAILFLNEFIFNLNQAKKNGWGLLFPSTITFLSDTLIYDFKIFLPTLNAVFIDDLNNIDVNLREYLLKKRDLLLKEKQNTRTETNSTANIDAAKNESLINFSIFILDINKCIRTGEYPFAVFNRLNQSEYIDQIDERIANPIRLMAMASRALVNKTMDGLITTSEFNMLLYDFNKKWRKLFIGLIYAREKDEMEKITFAGKSLKDMLAENEKIITDLTDYMYKYTIIAGSVQERINILRDIERYTLITESILKELEQIKVTEFHNYLDIIYKIIDYGLELKAFDNDIPYDPDVKKEYLGVLKNLIAVSQNVIDTNYSLAILNIVKLLNTMQIENADSIKKFLRYGNFMVSIVSSETALDMEQVLEAIAMPVGGYRITRISPFSFSICAYAGISGGREILTTEEKIKDKKARWNLSPAVPIGLSFSKGGGSFNKPGPSWSLFLPIIDIGASFSWRLGGEDRGIPKLGWKNVLAPGAYIIYGIKNSPISIGAGIQYGPALRQIAAENDLIIESSAFRIQILLGIEIPILNIYSRGKKNNR